MTVNQVAKPDSYPLPRINDLLARLDGQRQLEDSSSQTPLSL